MKWHPDKNPNNKKEAEAKFKQISEAYEASLSFPSFSLFCFSIKLSIQEKKEWNLFLLFSLQSFVVILLWYLPGKKQNDLGSVLAENMVVE